ncbi:hypothetical protein SAMN04488144_1744, partial [Methylobacterium sp. 190mf]
MSFVREGHGTALTLTDLAGPASAVLGNGALTV